MQTAQTETLPPWTVLMTEDLSQKRREEATHLPHFRMSSAGKCPRRNWYAGRRTPESDPPTPQDRNRLDLGNILEALIVLNLKENGWETQHTCIDPGGQLEVTLPDTDLDPQPTGHPDGIARHPEHTRNRWVTLECKSMSPHMADRVSAAPGGICEIYPDYQAQIAVYGHCLHRMGLVSHPHRGVFAIMDREGRNLPPDRIAWTADYTASVISNLTEISKSIREGRQPERPYSPDSRECSFCPYHSLCWESEAEAVGKWQQPSWHDLETRTLAADPELAGSIREWLKYRAAQEKVKVALETKTREWNGDNVACEGVVGGYFYPKDAVLYDPAKLSQMLTQDQLRDCLMAPPQPRYWVREAGGRQRKGTLSQGRLTV